MEIYPFGLVLGSAFMHVYWNMLVKSSRDKLVQYVFLTPIGDDKIKRFDRSWKTACKKSGVGPRLFHDLRRTAVRTW